MLPQSRGRGGSSQKRIRPSTGELRSPGLGRKVRSSSRAIQSIARISQINGQTGTFLYSCFVLSDQDTDLSKIRDGTSNLRSIARKIARVSVVSAYNLSQHKTQDAMKQAIASLLSKGAFTYPDPSSVSVVFHLLLHTDI